ncbi:hypothetical protein J437_LFUL017511 [Ladona fulva]|uniref:Cuticle protein 7 n=1 Tax=Ladona fulva TaxID=123851 RepID=A0A8K0KL21_LADFU|nr:hypothetical protein J437_LFUL017511 [Ladona fulva]
MKVLVVISAVLAVAAATGTGFAYSTAVPYLNGLGYNGHFRNAYGYNGILPYAGYHGYSSAVLPYAAHHVAAPYTAHHVAAPYAAHHYAAPIAYNALATKSQYHAQDELGQASFGHATHDQTHTAFRNAFGGVTGHYSYINPEGKIVEASYVADSLGYRVASNDLPVAPAVPAVPDLVGPAPVQDTPEVVAARAEHLAAHAEAKSRQRRQAILPLGYNGLHAYPYALPYTAHALPYAAHHVRPATLTTIVNNPGHAVSYRVD